MLDFSQVELIDPGADESIGSDDKLAAHVSGRYHRAISVLLVDNAGRHILQRRADTKYHCPGLWANACCSHPAPGEPSEAAASRRLFQELGISGKLFRLGVIRYRARVPALPGLAGPTGTLIEHERVALFCMRWEGGFAPNPGEVQEIMALGHDEALTLAPEMRAPWLTLYLDTFGAKLPAIVDTHAAGDWSPRDYGKFDL